MFPLRSREFGSYHEKLIWVGSEFILNTKIRYKIFNKLLPDLGFLGNIRLHCNYTTWNATQVYAIH